MISRKCNVRDQSIRATRTTKETGLEVLEEKGERRGMLRCYAPPRRGANSDGFHGTPPLPLSPDLFIRVYRWGEKFGPHNRHFPRNLLFLAIEVHTKLGVDCQTLVIIKKSPALKPRNHPISHKRFVEMALTEVCKLPGYVLKLSTYLGASVTQLASWERTHLSIQRSAKVLVRGLVKFVPAS